MKKKSGFFLILLALVCCLMFPCAVWADGNGRVYDNYEALTQDQEQALNEEIRQIYDSCEVDVAVLITADSGYSDKRVYAAEYMQENEIGAGASNNGVILLHHPDTREIWIVFRGDIQYEYDTDIQDIILEDCKTYLRQDAFYDAYETVVRELANSLPRAVSGESVRKMDLTGEGILSSIPGFAGISFLVTAIPVLFLSLFQKGKMKSAVPQANANVYVPVNGFKLRQKQDRFLRTVTTRTRKPKDHSSGGGGGGGGHFSSGGESFSGSGGKY